MLRPSHGLATILLVFAGCSGGGGGDSDGGTDESGAELACRVASYCVNLSPEACEDRNGDADDEQSCRELGYTCADDDRLYPSDDPDCRESSSAPSSEGSCTESVTGGERCETTTESSCSGTFRSGSCSELAYPWTCGATQYDEPAACIEGCILSCSYLGDHTELEPFACADRTFLGRTACTDVRATECQGEFTDGATCESQGYDWVCDGDESFVDELDCWVECAGGVCRERGELPDDVGPTPLDPADGLPAGGGVLAVDIISKTETTLDFEIDVFVIDGDGDLIADLEEGDLYFMDETFDWSGDDDPYFSFTQTCFTPMETPENGPYSAIMLMDQSGSISGTDPGDTRIEAAKIFFGALGQQDEAILAAFASAGSLGSDFVSWGEFNQPADYDSTLDSLTALEGGGTPLFDATVVYTDKVAAEGGNENKAVIVFTDGADTESNSSLAEAANNANEKGVTLFTVGLSSGVDQGVLQQLAFRTGGSMMYTEDASNLVALYGTLGNLLSGGVAYYHTCWTVERDKQDFANGYFGTSLRVTSGASNVAFVPVHIEY